jgi:hypothetical protein
MGVKAQPKGGGRKAGTSKSRAFIRAEVFAEAVRTVRTAADRGYSRSVG